MRDVAAHRNRPETRPLQAGVPPAIRGQPAEDPSAFGLRLLPTSLSGSLPTDDGRFPRYSLCCLSLEAILTASPHLFCALGGRGAIFTVNAAVEAVFGYSEGELKGHSLLTLLESEDRPSVSRAMSNARDATEGPLLLRVRSSAGHLRPLSMWFSHDPGSDLILGWGGDVTESQAIREELRIRVELLEDLRARRTRALAELQTRFEDLRRRRPTDEIPDEESRASDRSPSTRMSGTIRSNRPSRTPSFLEARELSWRHRSASPPRMAMGRFEQRHLTFPESASAPVPETAEDASR